LPLPAGDNDGYDDDGDADDVKQLLELQHEWLKAFNGDSGRSSGSSGSCSGPGSSSNQPAGSNPSTVIPPISTSQSATKEVESIFRDDNNYVMAQFTDNTQRRIGHYAWHISCLRLWEAARTID
jgi:hypothetical protein